MSVATKSSPRICRAASSRWVGLCALTFAALLFVPNLSSAQQTGLEKLIKSLRESRQATEADAASDEASVEEEENKPVEPVKDLETVPVGKGSGTVDVQTSPTGTVSVVARQADVTEVLEMVSQTQGFNLVMSASATKTISITLKDVPIERALDAVVEIAGLIWIRRDNIILVTEMTEGEAVSPQLQNRVLRVFELDYAAVDDVEAGVQLLLSPVGTVSVHQTVEQNIRQTKNLIVVEDLPAYIGRVEQYISEVDQKPRQVMIEARVLEVKLTDNYAHGVNLLYQLAAGQGSTLKMSTKGFANTSATQALLFTLTAENVNNAVELIETTLDSKTLASPRILAVNGQEAQIQVGGQLGFRVLTTTQTSTLEQVQFLNTGVILRIIPFITRDGQILMRVHPEVSTGEINEQGLPEAQTTTVDTQVVLPDGQGMVIGGLIRENYVDRQNKIPVLGDIKLVGRLFQRRGVDRERTEVIIALIPRIVPFDCETSNRDREELARTDAPIYRGPLGKNPRPWEPKLYDAVENPRLIRRLHPWNRRMNPKDNNTFVPYPTEPASKACLDDPANCETGLNPFDPHAAGEEDFEPVPTADPEPTELVPNEPNLQEPGPTGAARPNAKPPARASYFTNSSAPPLPRDRLKPLTLSPGVVPVGHFVTEEGAEYTPNPKYPLPSSTTPAPIMEK